MNQNKNLFSYLSMWWEERRLNQPSSIQRSSLAEKWLPNRANVLLSVITIMTVFGLNRAGALTLTTPAAAPTSSTNTIPYQGRIANASGQAITGTQPMIFRLYNVASGGTHVWEEQWTGPNSVRVSDGLFNVMLGSLNGISQAIITGNPNLWLGITVGSDNEMTPRVQLGSVPFATQALTVPDGSIDTNKIKIGAITNDRLQVDANEKCIPGSNVVDITMPGSWAWVQTPLSQTLTLTQSSKVMIYMKGISYFTPSLSQHGLQIWVDGLEGVHSISYDTKWYMHDAMRIMTLGAGVHILNLQAHSQDLGIYHLHPLGAGSAYATCIGYFVIGI